MHALSLSLCPTSSCAHSVVLSLCSSSCSFSCSFSFLFIVLARYLRRRRTPPAARLRWPFLSWANSFLSRPAASYRPPPPSLTLSRTHAHARPTLGLWASINARFLVRRRPALVLRPSALRPRPPPLRPSALFPRSYPLGTRPCRRVPARSHWPFRRSFLDSRQATAGRGLGRPVRRDRAREGAAVRGARSAVQRRPQVLSRRRSVVGQAPPTAGP